MRTAALALAALLLTAAPAPGTPIGALDEADRAAVEALALYDEATTRHALQAVTEADVLSDVVRQQERSSERFRQLLSSYQRDVQEQLFEITRYPELIAQIVEGGPKSSDELEAIAAPYPEEARAAALAAGSSHWKVLARIDALLRDEAAWLEERIAHLPEAKREAFRGLVATPELMALLAENTALAVLLGDAYEREPETVLAWLAEVRHQAEQQSAEEAREFAQGVEDNPELAGEFEAATSAYQQETGYSAYQPTVVHNTFVNVRPYSYWVGYPWWYDVSYGYYAPWYYWYPRPYLALGGFHFGPRLLVSFGLPHGGFWGWFFHRPIHHHRYARVTHHVVQHGDRYYVNHYQGYWHRRHRVRHRQAAAHAVYRFRRDAKRSMPHGFLRDHPNRVDRFREYGRVRSDWEREHRRDRNDASQTLRRTEMLTRVKADGRRYPHLQQLARQPAERPKQERGEKRARELVERKARATGGGFDLRVPPPRQAKIERRSIRAKPGRAERSQSSERGSAT
ncbi:MAG: DUF3300 domain-containing protein, partial [Deltaproteobacteria bacterium]|nr:DUF3300 domain-containing protein [Deltaproteobacteria bacterium]